jgi:hypothetical protein
VGTSPYRTPTGHFVRSPFTIGLGLARRVFNLRGSAVDNAAASVRADDAAREARESAAEAVALAAETAELDATDPGAHATRR